MASREYSEKELADFIWDLLGTSKKDSVKYKHLLPYIEDMGLPFADDIYSLFEIVDPKKTGTISYFDFLDILSNEFHPLRNDAALDSLYKNIVGTKGNRIAAKDLMNYAQDHGIEISQQEAAEIAGRGLKVDEFKDMITS